MCSVCPDIGESNAMPVLGLSQLPVHNTFQYCYNFFSHCMFDLLLIAMFSLFTLFRQLA